MGEMKSPGSFNSATDMRGMRRVIYANYAATTPSLTSAVTGALVSYLGGGLHLNAGRNFEGLEDGAVALRARLAIGRLLGVSDPLRVILTSGATEALNMALRGLLRPGDHALASGVEHNAVARPLHAMLKEGLITLDWLPCAPDGSLDPSVIRKSVRRETRLLALTHASNVLGTILPVEECFKIAKEFGLITILDAAQTAGVFPVAMGGNTDAIAFAGHKGLRGLAGIGGLALGETAAREMRPYMTGGAGGDSRSLDMPDFAPDKFEPGTRNTVGALSLAVSAEEILSGGIDAIRAHEVKITARFMEGLAEIPGIKIHGTRDAERSVSVVSVSHSGMDAGEAAAGLFEKYGIITRGGLHCAPLAHRTAGTFPKGTLRFSFGHMTTDGDVDEILAALREAQRS